VRRVGGGEGGYMVLGGSDRSRAELGGGKYKSGGGGEGGGGGE